MIKLKTKRHFNTLSTGKHFIIFLFLIWIFSCKKNSEDNPIPNVPVNFTIYLSLPEYASLNSIGSYVLIDTYGYRGIVVYRRSLEEFVSYDLACPYDPTISGVKLSIDSSGVTTVDLHCGSKFNLYDGSVLHGPATRPMKAYNSIYDAGSNSVYVSN